MPYSISIEHAPLAPQKDAVTAGPRQAGRPKLDNSCPKLIKTHNQTGYITTYADPFIEAFTHRAKRAKGPVLELAAGYGLPSIAAVEAGCRDVTISDIDPSHLDYAKSHPAFGGAIQVVQGALPDHPGLATGHYELILVSRVLHFFDGPAVRKTLQNVRRWLRPDGEAIIVCDSIHQGQFRALRPEFENRVRAKASWPGHFTNMASLHGARSPDLPDSFHFFDASTLARELTASGFDIEVMSVFPRPEYPLEKQQDGREGLGAIVRKSRIRLD